MSQSVQSRVGHNRVREQSHPVLRRSVAGDDDGGFEMSFSDQLVNVFGLNGRERGQTKVVQDQYIRLEIPPDALFPGMIRPRSKKVSQQFGGFCLEHVIAFATGVVPQCLSDMRFPDAHTTVDQHMLFLFHKQAGGKL